jgi:polyisoprenoid-binding protein YceI
MSAQKRCILFGFLSFTVALAPRQTIALAQDKPALQAKVFDVDTDASRVYVKVLSASRLGHEHGVEGKFKSGKIALGGTGEFLFDMTTFAADGPAARKQVGLENTVNDNEMRKVTDAMRSNKVLDVERFPTAAFAITSAAPLDKQAPGEPGNYRLEGTFTLHGTEKVIAFHAKVEKSAKPGVLRMTGSFPILQTDYGITPYSALGGLAKVADKVEILGDIVLKPGK